MELPKQIEGGPHNPSNNEDLHDSLGNPKTNDASGVEAPISEAPAVGPRGANVSPEHLTEQRRKEIDEAIERKRREGMSSTDQKDSIGEAKGTEDEPAAEHIGPRGKGTPNDSFHGAKK